MEIVDSVKRALQELVLPELGVIRAENAEIRATLQVTNQRLDDVTAHLIDQSRRIDETNKRIDEVRTDLIHRIDEVRTDLVHRIDGTNQRLDRLSEVIVRRDEQSALERRLERLEHEVADLRARVAA